MSDIEGMDTVFASLELYTSGLHEGASLAATEIASLLENYAKANHPWTRRTGQTDATTLGTVIEGPEIIDIFLSAGMDYDVFLELLRQGKWAWLWPAIEANREQMIAILMHRLSSGSGSAQGGSGD